jgi:photosystem II stability/assembly factor-like uncharacterized protein
MRAISFILIFFLGFTTTWGQVFRDIIQKNIDRPFEQIVQEVEAHYRNKDKGRGTGYKQFKRWEYFNASRLGEDGRLQNVPKRVLDEFLLFQSTYQPPADLNFDCEWESIGGTAYQVIASGHNGGLGRVNCIVPDPDDSDIIYAGTPGGGLWRTDNGGGVWNPAVNVSNWVPLTDGLPNIGVSGVAVDPGSPAGSRTLYILTGDGDGGHNPSIGVLKSFDGGDTWYLTGLSWSLTNFVFGYKLVMHPDDPDILFAVTSIGIFRTLDGGITWANVRNGWFFDIEFRPGTPDTMYAVTAGNFFRSIDGGANWTPVTAMGCNIANVGPRLAIAVTPADPDYVYVLSGGNLPDGMGGGLAGTFSGLYRSTDSGGCFQLRSTTPNILDGSTDGSGTRQQAGYDHSIAASPTDAEVVHVGGINCWRSIDGGQNWTQTSHWNESSVAAGDYTHADIHALDYIGNTLYCGSDGGVYLTTNNADDWVNISQGLKITQFYRIAAFSAGGVDYIMGGAQDNGLNQIRDSGSGFGNIEHWEGADGFECSVDVANGFVYGTTQNGPVVRFAYPGGGFGDFSPAAAGAGAWLTPHTFDAVNGALLVGFQDLWRTPDNGNTWANISNGNIGTALCAHVAVAPSNDSVIYVSKPTNLYRTTDAGANWADITGTLPAAGANIITYFAIDPADPDRIWVTLGGFVEQTNSGYQTGSKVFFSPDAGATWQNISGSLPNIPANTIVYEAGSNDGLYVGMDVGVYYRDNTLSDWLLFSNGLPNVIISELEINYTTGKLYAGTFGRGVWCSDLFSACNRVCLDCPEFSSIQSLSNTYSSESCIHSSAEIFEETDIIYRAEDYILLTEDFHVSGFNEASFHGLIATCTFGGGSSLQQVANMRGISGYYVGELPGIGYVAYDPEVVSTSPQLTFERESPLKAYPNPAQDVLILEFEQEIAGAAEVTLYNIVGKKVRILENNAVFGQGIEKRAYNIHDLIGGTYVLEVRTGGKRFFQTIIKLEPRLRGGRE